MSTRFLKSFVQNKKEDQHIPAIAGTFFGVFLIIAILGAIIGDGKYSDAVLGA
ncbi:MAG: hypothetical protein HYU84_06650, partial [Chloroflexi bacterium]|nr:hypothetical protein [Chloroflexota bacterium]